MWAVRDGLQPCVSLGDGRGRLVGRCVHVGMLPPSGDMGSGHLDLEGAPGVFDVHAIRVEFGRLRARRRFQTCR